MDVIPDPEYPHLGIDTDGTIVRRLFVAKMHDDGSPPRQDEFQPAGWIKGIAFTYEED